MRNHYRQLIILPCLLFSSYSHAYEVDTHENLSEAAFLASRLGSDSATLTDMGINAAQEFPDSKGVPRAPVQLMMLGANFEDNLSLYRPINHFFNPLNGSALTGVPGNHPSPDWALEEAATIGLQDYSYRDARDYFYKALTLPDKTERDKNAGLTFQTIGMVIHHIQDMAQPQHVRNDAHLDLGGYFPGIENPSLYEQYTNWDDVRNSLPFSGYAAVYSDSDTSTFNTPRYFWTKTTGAGLAQFTNGNFVSAGTNFDNPGIFNFPLFDPAKRIEMGVEDLCLNTIPACPPGLTGKMTFYGNTVEDRHTGQTTLNPLASTESLFSADLEEKLSQKVFTLNRFNFAVAHGFLIPRAVGYSAGMINYFFRGKLDFIPDPDHPGKYIIKNLGSETMNGTFALYYDDKNKERHPWKQASWDLSIEANGQSEGLELPIELDPEIDDPRKYMLVFKGDMGEEKLNGDLGAVVGLQVNDPLVLTAMGALFAINTPSRYNPIATYFMNVDFKSSDLGNEVWQVLNAASQVSIRVNGEIWPTTAWSVGTEGGFYAREIKFPYREFDFRVKSQNRFSLDLDNQLSQVANIAVLVDNIPLFAYTFNPTSEASPVLLNKTLHLIADPNGVKYDRAIYLDTYGKIL